MLSSFQEKKIAAHSLSFSINKREKVSEIAREGASERERERERGNRER
jgi:hypothetical protein